MVKKRDTMYDCHIEIVELSESMDPLQAPYASMTVMARTQIGMTSIELTKEIEILPKTAKDIISFVDRFRKLVEVPDE
jgi:hypothetical protein